MLKGGNTMVFGEFGKEGYLHKTDLCGIIDKKS